MQIWALIVDSFRESRDRKIFWVMLFISLLISALMFCIGFKPGRVDILFGTWQIETDMFTVGNAIRPDLVATIAVEWILDVALGWIGIILALIATAAFFPTMMERGAIEVLLSKPIARWRLFLGKYLGSMVFIAFHATVFGVLTFLIIGIRWKAWIPGYLLAIPLIVILFSYLYCVSALVAVWTRSTVAAVLLSLGAWVVFAGVQSTADMFPIMGLEKYKTAHTAAKVARWVVPKTQDITYLAKKWSGGTVSTEFFSIDDAPDEDRQIIARAEDLERHRMEVRAVYTIGSSLLFEALIIALAMWKFTRQDY